MTGETVDTLNEKIREKTDSFKTLWDESPVMTRMVFNTKMDQIQRSCKIEHRRRQLVKEKNDNAKTLTKIGRQNTIIALVYFLFYHLFQYFTFLHTELYQSSSPPERAEAALIFGGFGLTVIFFRELYARIELNSTKNKLDIIQLLPDNLHVENGFYNFFVGYDDGDDEDGYDFNYKPNVRDELEDKKRQLGILKSKEKLLIQTNGELKISDLLYERWVFNEDID